MNCPFCKADTLVIQDDEISIDVEVVELNNVMNVGHINKYAEFWFELDRFRCNHCGNDFWIQSEGSRR